MDAADEHEFEHNVSHDAHPQSCDVRGVAVGGALGRHLVVCEKSKFYGAFVLNRCVDLHVIDATVATPARCRGDVGSSPLD